MSNVYWFHKVNHREHVHVYTGCKYNYSYLTYNHYLTIKLSAMIKRHGKWKVATNVATDTTIPFPLTLL